MRAAGRVEEDMDHDDRCARQDTDLALLKEQFRAQNDTMREVVNRVQELVLQFHAQNVAQTEMRGDVSHIRSKVDEIEKSLEKDFALRSEFAEVKGEWRKFLGLVLASVLAAILGGLGWLSRAGVR